MRSYPEEKITSQRRSQIKQLIDRIKINPFVECLDKEHVQNGYLLIDEALTHTSANSTQNHERLEFLGDAVLRLAASEFIDTHFSGMNVGERSSLRSQLVSDRWLTSVGKDINIIEVLIIGPKAAGDNFAIETIEAETTEALIGAIYQWLHELKPIHKWLSTYWNEESREVLANPNKHNSKSALQEWSQKRGLNIPRYEIDELSKQHGSTTRFFCKVFIGKEAFGKASGRSRKEAEKKAACAALEKLHNSVENNQEEFTAEVKRT